MHAASRGQFPPLISRRLPSRFRSAFTRLHLLSCCRSQSLAMSRSLSSRRHQDVTHSAPFHVCLPKLLFFSLPISMCLILLFLSMSLSYPSHFFTYFPSDAFFSTLTYIFFYFQVLFYCCLAPLSCAFHLRVMDFNPYQPTYKGMKSREGWFALSFLTFMKL